MSINNQSTLQKLKYDLFVLKSELKFIKYVINGNIQTFKKNIIEIEQQLRSYRFPKLFDNPNDISSKKSYKQYITMSVTRFSESEVITYKDKIAEKKIEIEYAENGFNTTCGCANLHNIVCCTCKQIMCTECAIDKTSIHYHHNLVTFNKMIATCRQKIDDYYTEISRLNELINKLHNKKETLTELQSDDSIFLKYVKADPDVMLIKDLRCDEHNHTVETVCTDCKQILCIKCLVDKDNIHNQHSKMTIHDKIEYLKQEAVKTYPEILQQIDRYHDNIINIGLIIDTIHEAIFDHHIPKMYNICYYQTETSENQIHELKFVTENRLNYISTSGYKLIKENCTIKLKPGYYLIVAVGGGGSGGKCVYTPPNIYSTSSID